MSRFEPALMERALRAIGRPPAAVPWASVEEEALELAGGLCRRFEGYYGAPYLCPARVWTIGYGATFYADGRRVRQEDPPISREAAARLLRLMLAKHFLPAVLELCPVLLQESPGRVAAVLDFTFNLGAGRLQASSLRRCVNAGDWPSAAAEFRKWIIGGGRPLRGLILRREAEVELL